MLGLWKELELEPHEEFEQQVATGDIRVFVLSSENLTRLNKFYAEVRVQHCVCVCVCDRAAPRIDCFFSPAAGGGGDPPGGQGSPAAGYHPLSLGPAGGAAGQAGRLLSALHWTQTKNHRQCELHLTVF